MINMRLSTVVQSVVAYSDEANDEIKTLALEFKDILYLEVSREPALSRLDMQWSNVNAG